jgi:hypothetical protein
MEKPNQFWMRIVLVLFGIIGIVLLGRAIMLPDSWGQYGYYRGAYVDQEANKVMSYGTNNSCNECHSEVNELASHSKHKRLSCEICHSAVTDHVKDGQKFADMKTAKGEEMISLCLKCHQQTVGRTGKIPTIVSAKQHLTEQNVKLTHTCDQCHTVHAPLENMNHVKNMRTLKETVNEN